MELGSIQLGDDGMDSSNDEMIEEGSEINAPLTVTIKPEDIDLVAMQANVSKDVAEKELKATNGDLAKAIINLMNK
jgi:NACalpha-BTF3-like transcription factor